LANINLLSELESPFMQYSQGVGLYRTEFSFINYRNVPTEEEQFFVYSTVVARAHGKPVTFRTFDLGGDKNFWNIAGGHLQNPLLGIRSTRLLLRHKDLFAAQIRAILRATDHCKARIMFPMMWSIEEYRQAKEVVYDCIQTLGREGKPCNDEIEIGMMLEVPSVLEIIDELSEEADFLSLGTNDLIQYLLAADRTSSELAGFYLPYHPSILRSIKRLADAAVKNGKPLSVCGDMAHEAKYIQYLLGVGVRELSVEPIYLDDIRKVISQTRIPDSERMVRELMPQSDMAAIRVVLAAAAINQVKHNELGCSRSKM